MRLLLILLRTSWKTVLTAGLIGAASGAASIGLVALIMRTLHDPNASTVVTMGLFAALCLVILITRIFSQVVLCRMTQANIAALRMGLCRKILESPLKHLEEIGIDKMLGCLTGDVNLVSQAINGVPVLAVNLVILACGFVYLGSLSASLLLCCILFGGLGFASYWYSSRWANIYVKRSRQAQDVLMKRVRGLIEGVKELKMHRDRRKDYMDQVTKAQDVVRESQYWGDTLHDAAIAWGRLTFFIAIGLLLFLWPRLTKADAATLTGYTLTVMYLMSPLEQIIGWLPFLGWAMNSVSQIERLGRELGEEVEQQVGSHASLPTAYCLPPTYAAWQEIALFGATHTYRREGQPGGFMLGPIDVTIQRGQITFIIGGNGSGKTTLAKLIAGLYYPESGQLLLDGEPIVPEHRGAYRQLFSVVFDDAMIFDSLWGLATADLGSADLDGRAQEYLHQLQINHVVTVTDGKFSTTKLSRGQRKRLALVTAYLEDRSIYLFDEWAADQDPSFRKFFYERLLPELKARGKTVIAVTHDDRYFAEADQLIKLEEGKLVHELRQEVVLQTLEVEP